MSWTGVRRWRETLRHVDPGALAPHLSEQGARHALDVSLDALSDEALARVAAMGGQAFEHAVIVAAATVFTAPLEWLAVLLGRGSHVTLKHATADPHAAAVFARTAQACGLPLERTADRSVVSGAPLVVVMGSDETVRQVRAEVSASARVCAHGHRVSLAWVPEADETVFTAVAADLALYDTRGCLSPMAVLTPLPLEHAVHQLASAMRDAEARWPRGQVTASEGARLRERDALARIVGTLARGPRWSVHGLPAEQLVASPLPRAPTVISASLSEAVELAARLPLSTVGTPGDPTPWLDAGATRICLPGRMQRPQLVRHHDGEDWLRATARWLSIEER